METRKIIAKEELFNARFPKKDVLNDDVQKVLRRLSLQKAERLGNGHKSKVKIEFACEQNKINQVNTTVWAATEDYVLLKGGLFLPVSAILNVEFG
jgi:hypothetical protein